MIGFGRWRGVVIAIWAAACLSPIRSMAGPAADAFDHAFSTELARHGVVGGGYGLVEGAGPARVGTFGLAVRAGGRKVDAETSYNWASITKTFTAIAILQLRDRGRLSLDDPATRYLPELRRAHNPFGSMDGVTIRQLLSHSAGFRNPTWPWDCDDAADCAWQPFEPTQYSQVAAMLPYTHIAFTPGSRWSYSNLGYVFLGQIIERLSGDDFEVYIDKNILKPLGMTESYFDRSPWFLQEHVSESFLRAGPKGALKPQPYDYDTGVTTSNSGLKAPISDMVKYLRFLIGRPGDERFEIVLRRASLEEMWRPVVPIAAAPGQTTAYTTGPHGEPQAMGLGFFVMQGKGSAFVFHDGDQGGFTSEMLIDPAGGRAAILVLNTTDTGPEAKDATHAVSNTEPDPNGDPRLALRKVLIDQVFTGAP